MKILGADTVVEAKYDRNENSDFLQEASVSGKSGNIDYTVTSTFGDSLAVELGTTTDDGTSIEAEGSIGTNLQGATLSKITASRSTTLRGQDYDLEISHDISASASKLKLSTVLGSGVTAIGSLSNTGGDSSMSYELEYETDLTAGRTVSASVSPSDGTGEIEYEDSATLGDATLTATIPLGGSPSVSVKRSFGF